jgi:acyl-coenzyme A thioesterase PaaI-like protein
VSTAFIDNDFCFACGSRNPLGLALQFYPAEDAQGRQLLCTQVRPQPHWQGWLNVMHGGLQATIMDDLMSNHLFRLEHVWAVSVELAMRFRRPVPLDRELLFTCWVTAHSGRLWELASECRPLDEPDSEALTTGTSKLLVVPRPQ